MAACAYSRGARPSTGPAALRGEVKATVPVGLDLPEEEAGGARGAGPGMRTPSFRMSGFRWMVSGSFLALNVHSWNSQFLHSGCGPGLCRDR